ncbi:hypothetical protein GCM10025867_21400 [Frondihabitans sucicola]|uniref:SGNH hydrolase-type esterase domain-containing protein n=1 Tax=Frondihabitans sucicola TaxID=1268041 RepID=A0ABN6XYF6_9MICO|nr:SGNH/GDSL hydrolase family protein [Frondihabitans sucicola]BDZ49899.1 hypothetical protein GCM10025867_21400 [Frondihabitans sucicola]
MALGDSYAAGFGLPDPTGEPVAACSQSSDDYPHRVAERLGLDLTDVSCSGATTANVVDTEQLGAAPQVDALGSRTRVVTISIGGNDADLFSTASSCIALGADGPVFDAKATTRTCKQTLDANGHDTLGDAIDTTVAKGLRKAFADVAAKAPNARVFVVGYPAIFPDAAHATGGVLPPRDRLQEHHGGIPPRRLPVHRHRCDLPGRGPGAPRPGHARGQRPGRVRLRRDARRVESALGVRHPWVVHRRRHPLGVGRFPEDLLEAGALHPNERGAEFLADRTASAISSSFAATSKPTSQAASSGFSIDLIWLVLAGVVAALVVILLVARRGLRRRREP